MHVMQQFVFLQFTGSQESILQIDGDDVIRRDSVQNQSSSPRRGDGISPLPEIRAVIVTDHVIFFRILMKSKCEHVYS